MKYRLKTVEKIYETMMHFWIGKINRPLSDSTRKREEWTNENKWEDYN